MDVSSITLVVALLTLTQTTLTQVGPGTECICFQEFGEGLLLNPLSIGHLHDGSGRILVAEQRGMIWIFNPDGSKNTRPYLDMSETDIIINTGLLNFAMHPNYTTNGLIYVHYNAWTGVGAHSQRITEMMRSSSDPDVVEPSSERILLDIGYEFYEPIAKQHGGALMFGVDGYLYVGFGDGNCCLDPYGHGQNKSTPHASVVRIDVDSRTGNLEYGIPPDNPFLDDPDAIPELYAYGLRQGYSAAVDFGDPNTGEGRGRMFLGDVGEVSYEEVNELFPGDNYGWPYWEGSFCHDPAECSAMEQHAEPVIKYNRTVGICVILEGIYRGCQSPNLNGWMIFLDYGNPAVFGAREQPDSTWTVETIPRCQTCPEGLTNQRYPLTLGGGLDGNGEFWFGGSENEAVNQTGGSVYKIVDPSKYDIC